jgi:Domain of unknown function (DUF4112)
MSVDQVLVTLGVLALVMIAFAGVFLVVARWLVLRLAERTSAEIARQIDRSAAAGRTAAYASAATEQIRSIASANGVDVLHANALLLRRIERLATFMDAAVRVPLLGRVGLDALLGLVPVVGDVVSGIASVTIILNAIQYGLPRQIVAKMLANTAVDLALGAIPIVGDLADIGFKANVRNVALMKQYLEATNRL